MLRYKNETHKNLMKDFYWFFYYNQYNEKYEHFRCADVVKDDEGKDIVVFYNN